MDFSTISQQLQQQGLAGRRYLKEGHGRYRDCLTICRSGRLLFERYCYGEAAGLVCRLWASGVAEDGAAVWVEPAGPAPGWEEAPRFLTAMEDDLLQLDGQKQLWAPQEDLRRVKGEPNGFRGLLAKLLGQ